MDYTEHHCSTCRIRVLTPRFCWKCGKDLLATEEKYKCNHCGNEPQLLTELTDSFCRACGKEAHFVGVK